MSDSDKRPGRPRLADSKPVSLRVADHRAALQAEGWKRAEVLVPLSLRPRLEAIARAEGAGLADTMSALLQYGVDQYDRDRDRSRSTQAGSRSALLDLSDLSGQTALGALAQAEPAKELAWGARGAQGALPAQATVSASLALDAGVAAALVPVVTLSGASPFAPPRAAADGVPAAPKSRPSTAARLTAAPVAVGASLPSIPGQTSPISTYLRKKKD